MKRFRFSLLTLLVGVVLAGGVATLNVYTEPRAIALDVRDTNDGQYFQGFCTYGWPFPVCQHSIAVGSPHPDDLRFKYSAKKYKHGDSVYLWFWGGLAADIAIGLTIVLGGAAFCEGVVRLSDGPSSDPLRVKYTRGGEGKGGSET